MGEQYGHVKISRKAYETDPFWLERRVFSRWEAWEYMIQAASYKPCKWSDGGAVVSLSRGETRPLSIRHLSDEWNWGTKKVRVFLDLIQEEGRIRAQKATSQGHTYLLVNYETYQSGGHRSKKSKGTRGAQEGHNSEAREAGKASETTSPNWVAAAGDLWVETFGGTANFGRIGKTLGPLVKKHGAEPVLAVWKHYLNNEPAEFVTPEQFASKYGAWTAKAGGRPERKGSPVKHDYSNATKDDGEERWAS